MVGSLELDEASTCLLLLMAVVLVCQALFLRPSAPLLHPILLGRQAEASRVRQPGESPVWTNSYATTGSLIVRPSSDVKTLRELVLNSAKPELKQKVEALARKLHSLAAKLGASAQRQRVVALACEEAQNLPLALACALVPGLLPLLLPQDAEGAHAILAAQRPADALVASADQENHLLAEAAPLVFPPTLEGLEDGPSLPNDSAAVDVYETAALTTALSANGKWTVVHLSHLNLTSAIYTTVQSLTSQNTYKLSSNDDILSDLPLHTPVGFVLALAAVHVQARFQFAQPLITLAAIIKTQPSVVFCSSAGAASLHAIMMDEFAHYPFNKRALASKTASLRHGLLSKSTLWDRFPLNSFRKEQQISSLRAMVVLAEPSRVLQQEKLDDLRCLFSAPVLQGFVHPLQPAPITLSHLHDFSRVHSGESALVGPPTANVEIKVTGVTDDQAMEGKLWCRGPALVMHQIGSKQSRGGYEWWDTGVTAHIMTNGTVKVKG